MQTVWNGLDVTNLEFDQNSLLLEQIRWHIVRDTSDLSIILLPDQASHRMLASTPIISNAGHNDSLSPPKVYIYIYLTCQYILSVGICNQGCISHFHYRSSLSLK